MSQKLSYAGITLPLTPSFIEDKWLKLIHDQYNFVFADFWNFDKPNSQTLPTPQLPVPPDFKLDVLTWPSGASNPAWFHTIVETNRLNNISAICSSNGYNTPQNLVMFDGRTGKTITASMYMLPARPLNQLGSLFNDLWLLTLTDQRFYWHYARGNFTLPESWSNLYSQLATALGITITPDTINSNYGTPTSKWVLPYQASTPAILDACANQIGQKVVVSLLGVVTTVNWTTARTAAQNYVNNINGVVISGGLITESSIGKYIPGSVQTLFLDTSSGSPATNPYVVTNTLSSLSISEYGTATGIPGYLQTIYADLAYTGSNTTAVNNYAAQAATDWYGWRLVDTDLVYPGIEPWVPTGWEETIEWTLKLVENNPSIPKEDGVDQPFTKTHIRRGAWIDFQVGSFLTQPTSSSTTTNINQFLITNEEDGEDYFIPLPKECNCLCEITSNAQTTNSEPSNTFTFLTNCTANPTTTPVITFTIEESSSATTSGEVLISQTWYPQGTGSAYTFQQSLLTNSSGITSSIVQIYKVSGQSLYTTYTDTTVDGDNLFTIWIGNSGQTQGESFTFVIDGSGNIIEEAFTFGLWNGSENVDGEFTFTVSGTTITVNGDGVVLTDFTIPAYQPVCSGLTSLCTVAGSDTGIPYLSAINTFNTVTIGTGLSFAAGVLSAITPTTTGYGAAGVAIAQQLGGFL